MLRLLPCTNRENKVDVSLFFFYNAFLFLISFDNFFNKLVMEQKQSNFQCSLYKQYVQRSSQVDA
jgi:hypothetical protein